GCVVARAETIYFRSVNTKGRNSSRPRRHTFHSCPPSIGTNVCRTPCSVRALSISSFGRINPSDLPQANHKSFSWRLAAFGPFMTPPRTNSRFATDALIPPTHANCSRCVKPIVSDWPCHPWSIAMLRLTSLFGKCIPKTPPHVDEPERTSNRLSRNQVPEQVCRFESGQSNADLQTPG